jgi:YD repeat-containing protein
MSPTYQQRIRAFALVFLQSFFGAAAPDANLQSGSHRRPGKTPLILATLLLLGIFSNAQAGTRPPITGWYVPPTAGQMMLMGSETASAHEICSRIGLHEFSRLSNNAIYCFVKDGDGNKVEFYYGLTSHVETCPTYTRVWGLGWGVTCDDAPEKKPDCTCSTHGNPVRMASKEKMQVETDYIGPHGLDFTRYYSSTQLRGHWAHSYERSLRSDYRIYQPNDPYRYFTWSPELNRWISDNGRPEDNTYTTVIEGPDGYGHRFQSNDQAAIWHAESDENTTLSVMEFAPDRTILKWRFTNANNDSEIYDGLGKLLAIEFADGRVQRMTYSDATNAVGIAPYEGLLIQVDDNFGRRLQLHYDFFGRLSKLIDPANNESNYTYYPSSGQIESVMHPDGLKRVYLFDEPENLVQSSSDAHLLTGISDELSAGNLVRYGIYKWNNNLPFSTEHAGGVYRYTFDLANNKVTDPLGAVLTYGFETLNGRKMQNSVTQPDGRGGSVSIDTAFDNNGNARVTRNANQVVTLHDYDPLRNLERNRIEAFNTPDARTISTQWHTTLRLPLVIAAPLLRTTFTYDPIGRLTSKSEQATTDANGTAAFTATLVGKVRTWTYTYTDAGLVHTIRGPRTDVDDTTTYDYDPAGNLTRIVNAANHVVTLSNYDGNGHPGRIVDANNLQTDLTYSPRGWLTSSKSGTELTKYDYDGVGHVTRATLPGGLILDYSYDAAQRLTGIADNLGNNVTYTLDAAGNRTGEATRDPAGTLARQITRIFDVLSRPTQVTGAPQ